MIVAPGAFFDEKLYEEFLRKTGPGGVNVLTHHIYNMGAGLAANLLQVLRAFFWFVGDDPKLIYRFVNQHTFLKYRTHLNILRT